MLGKLKAQVIKEKSAPCDFTWPLIGDLIDCVAYKH